MTKACPFSVIISRMGKNRVFVIQRRWTVHITIKIMLKTLQFIKLCKGDESPNENSKNHFGPECVKFQSGPQKTSHPECLYINCSFWISMHVVLLWNSLITGNTSSAYFCNALRLEMHLMRLPRDARSASAVLLSSVCPSVCNVDVPWAYRLD